MRLVCSVALTVLALCAVLGRAAAQDGVSAKKRRGNAESSSGELHGQSDDAPFSSSAPEPRSRRKRPISVGLLLGYGHSFQTDQVNPWGVGFGARGGYNLGPLFLGARFAFYMGHEPSSIWELGLETGYDVRIGVFSARPGVGLGIASTSVEMDDQPMDAETESYFAPGLTLMVDVAPDMFIGAEGRVQMIFSDPGRQALIALGNVGLRF